MKIFFILTLCYAFSYAFEANCEVHWSDDIQDSQTFTIIIEKKTLTRIAEYGKYKEYYVNIANGYKHYESKDHAYQTFLGKISHKKFSYTAITLNGDELSGVCTLRK